MSSSMIHLFQVHSPTEMHFHLQCTSFIGSVATAWNTPIYTICAMVIRLLTSATMAWNCSHFLYKLEAVLLCPLALEI